MRFSISSTVIGQKGFPRRCVSLRYIPNVTYNQQHKDATQILMNKAEDMYSAVKQMNDLPRNPISDHTNFIVTSTTVDTSKMDERFDARNNLKLLAIDKFPALAALDPMDEAILQFMWIDLKYAIKFEFWDRAEDKALEIINVYNTSRGRAGQYNFGEQLITTKEILVSKHKQEIEEAKRQGLGLNPFRKRPQVIETSALQGAQNQ